MSTCSEDLLLEMDFSEGLFSEGSPSPSALVSPSLFVLQPSPSASVSPISPSDVAGRNPFRYRKLSTVPRDWEPTSSSTPVLSSSLLVNPPPADVEVCLEIASLRAESSMEHAARRQLLRCSPPPVTSATSTVQSPPRRRRHSPIVWGSGNFVPSAPRYFRATAPSGPVRPSRPTLRAMPSSRVPTSTSSRQIRNRGDPRLARRKEKLARIAMQTNVAEKIIAPARFFPVDRARRLADLQKKSAASSLRGRESGAASYKRRLTLALLKREIAFSRAHLPQRPSAPVRRPVSTADSNIQVDLPPATDSVPASVPVAPSPSSVSAIQFEFDASSIRSFGYDADLLLLSKPDLRLFARGEMEGLLYNRQAWPFCLRCHPHASRTEILRAWRLLWVYRLSLLDADLSLSPSMADRQQQRILLMLGYVIGEEELLDGF